MSSASFARSVVTAPQPAVHVPHAARGAQLGFWAAAAWIALGIESLLRPQQHNYRDVLWLIPFLLSVATFCYLHVSQRASSSKIERYGFYAVLMASILAIVGNVGVLTGIRQLAVFGFPWGAVVWTVGLIAYGIGTWRAKILPRYVALALILLEPGSILTGLALAPVSPLHDRGAYSAGIEKGLVLAILAMGMRSLSGRRAVSP